MENDRIYPRHVRRAGWCVAGVRRWCVENDIDFRDFLKHGVAVADLVNRDDALVRRVIQIAKQEAADGK